MTPPTDDELAERIAGTPPVPEGYTVIQLDGRWRLFGEGCTESDLSPAMARGLGGALIRAAERAEANAACNGLALSETEEA